MKKHKLLAVFLALAMTLSLLPTAALAEGETVITADTPALTTGNYILNGDVSRTSALTVAEGATATLDLNGHTISSAKFTTIINNGTLTIKDSKGSGRVVSTGAVAVGAGDNSTTTIKSGTFESVEGAVITGYATGATINIEGGTFSASDNAVVAGNGNRTNKSGATRENPNTINISGGIFNGGIVTTGYVACGIYAPWKDTINVSGGTFNITGGAGIVARAGNVNVTGGTFNTTGNATGKVGDSRVVVPCSAIVFDSAANYPAMTADSKITVTGGKFTSAVDVVATVEPESSVATRVAVSGGTFSSNPDAYLVNGFSAMENAGTWTISDPVAEIGDVKYGTLAAAIAAVPSSGTQPTVITLLRDVENAPGMAVAGGKNFIVDFDKHTYTLNKPGAGSTNTETNGFQLLKDSTIVFKDGTINISESNLTPAESGKNIMRVIQNYANLTLENMTIDGTNQYGGATYVMSFNNDPVSIIGDTSIIAAEGKVAFDADGYWGGYQRCEVTVNTTGTITGNIEVGQGYLNIENAEVEGGIVLCTSCGANETTGQADRISVTGGTFSSNPTAYVSTGYHVAGTESFSVHKIVEVTLDGKAATCTETGLTEGKECSVCDTVLVEQSVIPATGHTAVTDDAVPATCTETGLTEGSHCSVCGATLVAQTTVPAAGHSFGDWNVTKEPTTTEAGSKTRECSVCHVEETVTIPALGVTTFTITPSVTNGTITPSEAVEVEEGGSQRFDFAPSTGYELGSVKVDGSDVDATTYYTFANVTADHTIVVVFTAKTPDTIPVESVTLNMTNMTLHSIGASNTTMPLTVTVTPANATDKAVTFSSSNEAVATVDQDGYVVAKAAGTAIITATVGGKTATCTVTVIIETEPETVQVGFKVTPASAAIVVKDASGNTVSANDDGSYTLLVGETYTYTISATGYKTKTASFVPSADEGGDLVTVTLTKQSTGGGGGGGGSTGGGSSSGGSSSGTTTEKNPDGSTTTTTTDKATGTVTETTKNTDGSTTTVETKKDGTVTETNKAADGTTGTVVTDKNGDVTEVKSTVSSTAAKEAAKTGEAVTLPVEVPAAKTTEYAPAVQVTVPRSADSVKVEIPVEQVTPGTVAVIVNADGTEKIVSTSMVTENGVALKLDGSATVKIIDNSKSFTDVPATNVFYNEISSLSAREIMIGKTGDKFDLHSSVTLDQIANVAGRIIGAVDVKDFNAGVAWGAESGLQTGNVAATRGDVLKALYIAAGSPAVEDTTILARFKDAASIPADMAVIAAWAAQNGILKGNVDGSAGLGNNVTRGQACALAGRTMGTLA